mmetsp:Transcript_10152/g.36094  ORF Transcript_10152/g.36094 Transcript_10152/m.36094 type:complete len:225 (+) Transcript_10152:2987-3661(+)
MNDPVIVLLVWIPVHPNAPSNGSLSHGRLWLRLLLCGLDFGARVQAPFLCPWVQARGALSASHCSDLLLLRLWRRLRLRNGLHDPLHRHPGKVYALDAAIVVQYCVLPLRGIVGLHQSIVVGVVLLPQKAEPPAHRSLLGFWFREHRPLDLGLCGLPGPRGLLLDLGEVHRIAVGRGKGVSKVEPVVVVVHVVLAQCHVGGLTIVVLDLVLLLLVGNNVSVKEA